MEMMRTEEEMIQMIQDTARKDDRIRAAYLEGSRANPKVPKDMFQDYDAVYIVEETESFQRDKSWIDRFGKRLYMQYPEDREAPEDKARCYGWLMQFADGNRMDLHVCTKEYARSHLELYWVLVDKDEIFEEKEMLSDERYWVQRPDQEEFSAVCNEFWWCLNNVAKGMWRREIPYVMEMLDMIIRPMLRTILEWKIGVETEFSVSAGKSGKYMEQYLDEDTYSRYLETYTSAGISDIQTGVEEMCRLFHETALYVSGKLDLMYNLEEAKNSREYLEDILALPLDAETILLRKK